MDPRKASKKPSGFSSVVHDPTPYFDLHLKSENVPSEGDAHRLLRLFLTEGGASSYFTHADYVTAYFKSHEDLARFKNFLQLVCEGMAAAEINLLEAFEFNVIAAVAEKIGVTRKCGSLIPLRKVRLEDNRRKKDKAARKGVTRTAA